MSGAVVWMPGEVVHAGGNVGPCAGRRVVIFSPAGLERFFFAAGATAPGAEVDLPAVLAAADSHGWEFVRPAP
jgi:hypothetical protein